MSHPAPRHRWRRLPLTVGTAAVATVVGAVIVVGGQSASAATLEAPAEPSDLERGLGHIRQMDGAFEEGDLELDMTYETWGTAQDQGPVGLAHQPGVGPQPVQLTDRRRHPVDLVRRWLPDPRHGRGSGAPFSDRTEQARPPC